MDDDRMSAYLYEYSELKNEQVSRINHRDHLLYVALATSAAVLVYSTKDDGVVESLLALPLATFVLGVTASGNDAKISAIREYVATNLRHALSAGASDPTLFAWEDVHRLLPGRLRAKLLNLLANLTVFIASGLLAIWRYITVAPTISWQSWAVITLDSALMLWLAFEFAAHADFSSNPNRETKLSPATPELT
jgi:hypothetical protein